MLYWWRRWIVATTARYLTSSELLRQNFIRYWHCGVWLSVVICHLQCTVFLMSLHLALQNSPNTIIDIKIWYWQKELITSSMYKTAVYRPFRKTPPNNNTNPMSKCVRRTGNPPHWELLHSRNTNRKLRFGARLKLASLSHRQRSGELISIWNTSLDKFRY